MKLLTLLLFLASNAMAFDVVGSLPQGLGDGRYVQKSGDTMSGPLTVASSLTVTGAGVVSGDLVSAQIASFMANKTITGHANYGFLDLSSITYASPGTLGHASFNDNTTISGSTDSDHHHGFQSTPHFAGSGVLSNLNSFYSLPYHVGLGTVTNMAGYKMDDPTTSGSITNLYGIYLANLTKGATNYSIYTGTAKSYFGGSVGVGTESPQDKLEVKDGKFYLTDTDVNHGATALLPSNAYASFNIGNATIGGLDLKGASDNSGNIAAVSVTGLTTSGSTIGAIRLQSGIASGIGWDAIPATQKALSIVNYTSENLTMLGNGNVGIAITDPSELLEVAGGIASYSRTMAQLLAITPSQVGVQYFCNNCTPAKMVVSTGTSAGNFADIMGGTFQ